MKEYLELLEKTYLKGVRTPTRTGIFQYTTLGIKIEHNLYEGFPLITSRKMNFTNVASELEFFIKGYTDKKWLLDRGNKIWMHWANPQKAPYGVDKESKKKMIQERDLGPIYGFQWRHFGVEYKGHDVDYSGQGLDQLSEVIKELKNNTYSKRLVVNAWNPKDIYPEGKSKMALPPCVYSFELHVLEDKLNLIWHQRALDLVAGYPHNLATNALLLHLLAKETNYKQGKVIGLISNAHIYENNLKAVKTLLSRKSSIYNLPTVKTENFKSIFEWKFTDTKIINYESHSRIPINIAV